MSLIFRTMTAADIGAVVRIQAEAYVDEILETEAIISARLAAVPECAWVVELARGVVGYLVGYQVPVGKLTPWGGEFAHQPAATNLYLHDLAIGSAARGRGLGPQLVAHAIAQAKARKLNSASLVSVQDSCAFWQSLGFVEQVPTGQDQQAHLDSYSGPAVYMLRAAL